MKLKLIIPAAAALMALALEIPDAGAQILLGYTSNCLKAISPETGNILRNIGDCSGEPTYQGVSAFDAEGHRYFVPIGGLRLRTINTETGSLGISEDELLGITSMSSMEFDSLSNKLFAVSGNRLAKIDPWNLAIETVATFDPALSYYQAVSAIDPHHGRYFIGYYDGGARILTIDFDRSSDNITASPVLAGVSGLTSLEFDPAAGILYGITSSPDEATPNSLIAINPETGAAQFIGTAGTHSEYFSAFISALDYQNGRYFIIKGDGVIRSISTVTGIATDSTFSAGTGVRSIHWKPARTSRTIVDFDADLVSDIAVFRPDIGTWFILNSGSPDSYSSIKWGLPTDYPVSADYDGDGIADVAVWRPTTGVWYILPSGSPGTYTSIRWGTLGDIPATCDYDGDGKDDIAVWRPGNGIWYVLLSNTPGSYLAIRWGINADIPVPGDYDGDGKYDFAVWRPGSRVWYVLSSKNTGSYTSTQWGLGTDIPVPGDYDGDGRTDIAVWRSSTGIWYILASGTPGSYTATAWGMSGDDPVSGDYDGDGKMDIAVWRPATGIWYILNSGTPGSYTAKQWGVSTDIAISALTSILRSIRNGSAFTIVEAADFSFNNFDGSAEQQTFGYPAHYTSLTAQTSDDQIAIGPGIESSMGSSISHMTQNGPWSFLTYNIPRTTRRLVWEMDVIPVTAMLKGSYANTSGTSTFIIQRFWFPSPSDGSAISEISHVPGYPIQIEQATGFGGQDPVWIAEKQEWACGRLAIKPKYSTSYPDGCALPYPDPTNQPASPFPEWNLDDNLVSHNFKLELDYLDWKVKAYIDGHIEGETGIMALDPDVISFEISYRTAPSRNFERIFRNIKIYYVE